MISVIIVAFLRCLLVRSCFEIRLKSEILNQIEIRNFISDDISNRQKTD